MMNSIWYGKLEMMISQWILITGMLCCSMTFSCGQSDTTVRTNVGGPCEGCEAVMEYGDMELKATDTLPYFEEYEPQLHISGIVFHEDGMTPAENVILYMYHTGRDGRYTPETGSKGWAQRHGKFRGWIKTDASGRYDFWTFRPAAYPSGSEPEHIHITVKEPNTNPYYIDAYLFSDDPLLARTDHSEKENRGGSGMITLMSDGDMLFGIRDIYLGRNIPNY